jgi:hypothetical protein
MRGIKPPEASGYFAGTSAVAAISCHSVRPETSWSPAATRSAPLAPRTPRPVKQIITFDHFLSRGRPRKHSSSARSSPFACSLIFTDLP